jgi:hypothetical protein
VGLIKALVGVHPDGIFIVCWGLDISTASEHCRSSSASRADSNSPGPAFGRPGSTSTFLGRYILPRVGTRLPRAGIFMSRPTYLGPGSTPALPRLTYIFSDRNICLRAEIYQFWHFLAGISQSRANLSLSRPALGAQGPGWANTPARQQVPASSTPGGYWAPAGPWSLQRASVPPVPLCLELGHAG